MVQRCSGGAEEVQQRCSGGAAAVQRCGARRHGHTCVRASAAPTPTLPGCSLSTPRCSVPCISPLSSPTVTPRSAAELSPMSAWLTAVRSTLSKGTRTGRAVGARGGTAAHCSRTRPNVL